MVGEVGQKPRSVRNPLPPLPNAAQGRNLYASKLAYIAMRLVLRQEPTGRAGTNRVAADALSMAVGHAQKR